MEGFYSSDEEIAWGPLTLREIKGDLSRPAIRKPQRRYTSHGVLKTEQMKTSKKNIKVNEMEPSSVNKIPKIVIQEDTIPEISDYLTASENANARNENSLSDYYSAVENLQNSITKGCNAAAESSLYHSSSDSSVVKNIEECGFTYNRGDMTRSHFVKNAMDRPSDYIFKNECQTLVEGCNVASENSLYYSRADRSAVKNVEECEFTYNRSDMSLLHFVKNAVDRPSDYIFKNERQSFVESPIYTPNNSFNESVERDTSENVIEISSDEDENMAKIVNLSDVQEISNEGIEDISCCTEKDCSREEKICQVESYCQENDNAENSAIDESTYQISPPISIPEIDLHQFNDSSPLNDTIEKITALLNQAENMSLTERQSDGNNPENRFEFNDNDIQLINDIKIPENYTGIDIKISNYDRLTTEPYKQIEDSTESITESDEYPQTCNLISGSFLQKPVSELPIINSPVKYHTPVKSLTPNKSYIPVPKKSPDSFRVPNIPVKLKSGQKISKPNLKNIVSPVRMYIKYSPKPVIKRNVVGTNLVRSPMPPESKNKENIDIFPPSVIYKPSKHPILGTEKNICLPASLEKMVIKSSIIRHERKPVALNLFNKNESLDAEGELTKASLSDSQLSESEQNMSVLHKRPAFRK